MRWLRGPARMAWAKKRQIVFAAVCGAWLVLCLNVGVRLRTAAYRFDAAEPIPRRSVAIVFGAGLFNGRPSPALADRLDSAIDLYRAGRVGHLLMSGDNSRADYDEVTAMRDYAIARGVPADAITRDYAGFSSYETCYRSRAIFGADDAILVTQDYHLPRAVYTCRTLGIDAIGLAVPDWSHHPERARTHYPFDLRISYAAREWLATVKAIGQLHLTRPAPTFLGPFEGLGEHQSARPGVSTASAVAKNTAA